MKQEDINFIRVRYSTQKMPPFIIVDGKCVEFTNNHSVIYEYMYGWYVSLKDENSNVDTVEPSMNYISDNCRVSLSTAKRIMKQLEQAGLLVVYRGKRGESNKYVCVRELNCAEWSDVERKKTDTKGTKHDVTKPKQNNIVGVKKTNNVVFEEPEEICSGCYNPHSKCTCEIPF